MSSRALLVGTVCALTFLYPDVGHTQDKGLTAVERCGRRPAFDASAGTEGSGGPAIRISVTAVCRSRLAAGVDVGMFDKDLHASIPFTHPQIGSGTLAVQEGHKAEYATIFASIPLGRVRFNPRLVGAIGAYRQTVSSGKVANRADGRPMSGMGNYTYFRESTMPGASVGLTVAMPLWSHVSIGLATRVHRVRLAERNLFESGILLRYRP